MNRWFFATLTSTALLIGSNLWWLSRVLLPLRRLSQRTANLAKGQFAAVQEPCGGVDEIALLQRSVASMAGHVRRAQTEGSSYHNALTNGQEAERTRIARELHDDTVQSLIAIAQSIELASKWIGNEPERAANTLKLARAQAVETVDNLRRLIGNLRPPALEELGLVPALRMLAQDIGGLSVDVSVEGPSRRLSEGEELTLFRAAQEALRNAQKHSGARRASVDVCYEPDSVRLIVRENGRGFDTPSDFNLLAEAGHFGLAGLSERVSSLGGTFHISSTAGGGTTVRVELPIRTGEQPSESVRDPVCGALIQPQQAYGSTLHQGQRYYFCCPVCQGAFEQNPEAYLQPER